MLTAGVINLRSRKCNMTAFTGLWGRGHFTSERKYWVFIVYMFVVPTKMDPSVLKGL